MVTLGYIDADSCNKILNLQQVSSCMRFVNLCTAPQLKTAAKFHQTFFCCCQFLTRKICDIQQLCARRVVTSHKWEGGLSREEMSLLLAQLLLLLMVFQEDITDPGCPQ